MNTSEKREKLGWFVFMIGYFTAGYLAINWFSQTRAHYFDPSFAFERNIPFVPEFIFGYVLVYLSVLLIYVVIDDMGDWHRGVIAFLSATTLAYAFFLALPVRMELRPEIWQVEGSSFAAVLTRVYYMIDAPYNLFPSLHVTYPTIALLVAWKRHRVMRIAFLAMTIAVAVSVVLVKQHYVADVLAGFANAAVCYALAAFVERTIRTRRTARIVKALEEDIEKSGTHSCGCACSN